MAEARRPAPGRAARKKVDVKKSGRKKAAGGSGTAHRRFVVSGGSGASGTQIVETVLAQFPGVSFEVSTKARVRSGSRVEDVVRQAASKGEKI